MFFMYSGRLSGLPPFGIGLLAVVTSFHPGGQIILLSSLDSVSQVGLSFLDSRKRVLCLSVNSLLFNIS